MILILAVLESYLQLTDYKKDYQYQSNLDYALVINEQFCTWNESLYSHPYLAFVHHKNKKCSLPLINSDGFPSPEFPGVKTEKYFDILITGGSVAFQLIGGLKSDLSGELFKELNKKFKTSDGRSVRVFSTAIGAWKQPQQMLSYLLYGDRFDGVVSLEGANELSHFDSRRKATEPFGIYWGVNIPSDVEIAEPLRWIRKLKSLEKEYSIFRKSLMFDIYKKTYSRILNDSYQEQYQASWSNRLFERKEEVNREQFVKGYISNLEKYHAMAQKNNTKLLVFIQPVLELRKYKFGNELKTPLELNKLKSYKVLDKVLKNNPVSYIKNLVNIFNEHKYEIYSDNVHYKFKESKEGPTGHKIVTDKIINTIKVEFNLARVSK
jgi:hypothetical protein